MQSVEWAVSSGQQATYLPLPIYADNCQCRVGSKLPTYLCQFMLTTAWLQHWYDTTSLSLFRYKDAFKADKITAFIFKRIDDSMLKDLGVVLESHRKTILEVAREDKLFARQKSKTEIAAKYEGVFLGGLVCLGGVQGNSRTLMGCTHSSVLSLGVALCF